MKPIKLLILLLSIITITSCSTNDNNPTIVPIDVPTVATLVTSNVSNVTMTGATCGGTITSDGDSPVTARGVVWDVHPNPTIILSTKTTDGEGIGEFESILDNLASNTTFYIRAYATNAIGTAYGNEVTLTTLTNPADFPVVTTTTATNITTSTVTTGGTVNVSGASPVSSRGVIWSTEPNPTLQTHLGISIDGTGIGVFVSNMTGLEPETTYYYKAYATNLEGTGYGAELTFTTSPQLNVSGSGVTDIDGNAYTSIIVNSQEWTESNLNVTKYNDGTPIPQVQNATAWAALTTGAWCYYSYQTANGTVYGKLYNWYAVAGIWNEESKTDATKRKKIAPTGWHVSSDAEWSSLITFLGGSQTAGAALKEIGTSHWQTPNTGATNSSGIKALPGGNCLINGTFAGLGTIGHWWSFDEYNPVNAWCTELFNNNKNANRAPINKKTGFSVRIIKD